MTPKTQKIAGILATVFTTLPITLSGIMKLSGAEEIIRGFTALGVVQYIPVLGTTEMAFAALWIPRKTMKLGFILLSCYFSGAMATELSHGMTPVVPAVLLAIIWTSAFIRDRSIFFPVPAPAQEIDMSH